MLIPVIFESAERMLCRSTGTGKCSSIGTREAGFSIGSGTVSLTLSLSCSILGFGRLASICSRSVCSIWLAFAARARFDGA
jgi:hypothetical protein